MTAKFRVADLPPEADADLSVRAHNRILRRSRFTVGTRPTGRSWTIDGESCPTSSSTVLGSRCVHGSSAPLPAPV